jgi:hypothetical protein
LGIRQPEKDQKIAPNGLAGFFRAGTIYDPPQSSGLMFDK